MRKRTVILILCSLMLISMTAGAEDQVYQYENRYLWKVPTSSFTWDVYRCLADHHKAMGGTSVDGTPFDIEDFINSPLGESLVTSTKNFILYPDELGEEEYAYWESLGIRKEMHDAYNVKWKWTTFTPEEAYLPENADKKYPVVFVYHGGNNPIYVTEGYGYAQLVAEKGFICVIPWNNSAGTVNGEEGLALDSEIDRIMEVLRAEYPIDESRIYGSGYSLGGRSTVREVIKHPNMFASVAVGGHNLGGIRQGEKGYTFSEEEWDAIKETPILQLEGDNEMRVKLPYGYGVTGSDATTALNRWFKINGIDRYVTLEGCQAIVDTTTDPVQRKIGLEADALYTQYYDNAAYYTADFLNEDGVNMIKIINVEGMIHWMAPSMARVAYDFMSQYARDTGTGELIVLNQDAKPQLEKKEIVYNTVGTFVQDYTAEARKGGTITINIKASDDVLGYAIKLKDGSLLPVSAASSLSDDGFVDWTLTTSSAKGGRTYLYLTPLTAEGAKDAIVLPVLVQ